ncbi:hypothetical protein ACE6H2_020044 [Prunus campanulata]
MFEDFIDTIHEDGLPRELEFFYRVLHRDVAVMLSLLDHRPFLKTHIEKMRYRFLIVRQFFDSIEVYERKDAMNTFKGYCDSLFANEADFEVKWHAKFTAYNPITSKKDNLVTNKKLRMRLISLYLCRWWMVDEYPIHYLVCARNCAGHGTHLVDEMLDGLHFVL